MGYSALEGQQKVAQIVNQVGIEYYMDKHPYDLSGGEQQKLAFAKILLMQPKIILLDEPTKGIDAYSKKLLADILVSLKKQGITIVIVTHDVEFSAEYADRCAMFFDGQIVASDSPNKFFGQNTYYTTASSRISRNFYNNAVTVDQVVELCKMNGKQNEE